MADTKTTTKITTEHYPIGTIVSYEDMGNPQSTGMVSELKITTWGIQYGITWYAGPAAQLTDRFSWSDLRQRGWTIGG